MEQKACSDNAGKLVTATSARLRYITMDQLRAKLGGRGRTSVYRDVEEGRLPKPLKFGARLYWRESDIDEWMAALFAEAV